MGEVGERDRVEEIGGLGERGRGQAKYFLSPPPMFFFLIEANSANQNAEY